MRLASPTILSLSILIASAGTASAQLALPCGLADPAGNTGIVANTTGGIDVIDLTTGRLLWETKEAQRPLLVLGERLYAQTTAGRHCLRVLAFDLAENGPCVLQSDTVELPDWVNVGEAPGRSFKSRWQRERNRLVLTWEAAAWSDAGPPLFRLTGKSAVKPGKERYEVLSGQVEALQAPSSRRQAAGRAAVNLETGKVEILPYRPEPPSSLYVPDEAVKLVVRWQREIGGNFTALTLDAVGSKEALVLRVWDRVTGKPAAPKELLRGERPIALTTVDGRILCLRDATPSPDKQISGEERAWKYGWSLFAPETGVLLGRLPFEPGTQAVAVVGPRAYYLLAGSVRGSLQKSFIRPQSLRAVDVKTGKTLWERPVEGKRCLPPGA